MTNVRVAIVGLGKMGLLHASILNVLNNATVVAFCEKSALVRRFARSIIPDIPFVRELNDLAGINPDGVYVTTPESTHYPIIKTIYDQSITPNIFVEKPLATSYLEAQELSNLATRSRGVNMVGYNRRYSVTFGKAKQILEEGLVGKLITFEGHAFSSDFVETNFNNQDLARKSALSDLGCHVIDLALWLFGPLELSKNLSISTHNIKPTDRTSFELVTQENSGSLKGILSISRCMVDYRLPEMALQINGTNGTIKVDEDKIELKLNGNEVLHWYKHDLDDHVPFFIGGTEYVREDMQFINSILNETKAEPDFQTASYVERIIEQLYSKQC
ncbi:Gfo/Idh/MocA family protein [Chloroflexota bacterium]